MTSRITLLGATGYTGGLVLEALLRQGVRPTIAGRNPAALTALAEDSGGLDHVVVDAARPDDLRKHLGHGDVLITTVGPFERYGFPVAQAAADAGAHYLDSTGEVGFVRALHARHHQRARETGAVMLPAFGYDYVPGVLAAALALREAGPSAHAVDIGYFASGPLVRGISQGTRTTMRDGLTLPSPRRQHHRLVDERTASRVRRFTVRGRSRSAFLVSGTEVLFLPEEFPTLEAVTVYNGWFPALSRPLSLYSALVSAAKHLPHGRQDRRRADQPGPPRPAGRPRRGPAGAHPVPRRRRRVRGPGSRPARRGPSGRAQPLQPHRRTPRLGRRPAATGSGATPGVVGPTTAFGVDTLRQGCAELGLVTA